jgi:spermidine synthase
LSRWELLDVATIPDGGGELRLYQRNDEFSLRLPGAGELMTSRTHGSEDALGDMTCEPLAQKSGVRILVGGLGMGFTLAAALKHLADDAIVEVAELLPEVVRWNEGALGACAGHPMRDPRTKIVVADVASVIAQAQHAYDAILLDVDNGPEGMTRRLNDRLYNLAGLAHAQHALKPGGVLAVWSASPDRIFPRELKKAGFSVNEQRVRAHANKGSRHVIWLATPPLVAPEASADAHTVARPAQQHQRRAKNGRRATNNASRSRHSKRKAR